MTTRDLLIEPTDILFFRDAIPMSAGQGQGGGVRLPLPSTMHGAFRASLHLDSGTSVTGRNQQGRPKDAPRGEHVDFSQYQQQKTIASARYQSLQLQGPLPWHKDYGLLFPIPLDLCWNKDKIPEAALKLLEKSSVDKPLTHIPVSPVPPQKAGESGWWTTKQYEAYLKGDFSIDLKPIPTGDLWQAEYRVGVEISPETYGSVEGQLYASNVMRFDEKTSLWSRAILKNPKNDETGEFTKLQWLLLGGERRLARLQNLESNKTVLPEAVKLRENGPWLIKWVLVTPSIFIGGYMPGWIVDGDVMLQLTENGEKQPIKAKLISHCVGKPMTISGRDLMGEHPKPTRLAVAPGAVYYFKCESLEDARKLTTALHWKPRSDFEGEKGFGYGFCGRAEVIK